MWNDLVQVWVILVSTTMALPKFPTFYSKINHILLRKQLKLLFQLNSHTKSFPRRCKNWKGSIKNQLIDSESALNTDQKH